MNVYDFDKTIYKKDSSLQFYFFCFKKKISIVKYCPIQFFSFLKYVFGKIEKEKFKSDFFSFLKSFDNIEKIVDLFWENKEMENWYLNIKKEEDVIISASPLFLIKPFCEKNGIKHVIASLVNEETGKLVSKNCYGKEKVKRFYEKFKKGEIENFYSDSLSDTPLSDISKNSFIVKNKVLTEWTYYKKNKKKKLKDQFFSKNFIRFLFIGGINVFNGVLFSFLFSFLFYPNVAFIVGYIFSLCISYFLNSKIVFPCKLSFIKFIKFCLSYIPNFIIQNICVIIIYNLLEFDKIIAYFFAAFVGVPITFLCIKFFVFERRLDCEKKR